MLARDLKIGDKFKVLRDHINDGLNYDDVYIMCSKAWDKTLGPTVICRSSMGVFQLYDWRPVMLYRERVTLEAVSIEMTNGKLIVSGYVI